MPSCHDPESPPSFYSNANLYFILEEIHHDSSTIRPATVRAIASTYEQASAKIDVLLEAYGDRPLVRRVDFGGIYRDGVYLGEGYEYRTKSLQWRTLWIQEGVQEEDCEFDAEGSDVGSEEDREEHESKDEDEDGRIPVKIQGRGARLSGGGAILPMMS